jgi:hypothetical protein
MSDEADKTTQAADEAESAAVEKAEADAEAWNQEWLKFPTISLDDEGQWHYWDVPPDSGVYGDDWQLGESLARDTVAQMQRFTAGSSALRRLLREMDFNSTIAQGFLNRIEDMLTKPDLFLDSLEPGAVRAKLEGGAS